MNASILKELREDSGLSQRIFSEKCGISRGRLRRLEGPEFEAATFGELRRISAVIGMDVREILRKSETEADGNYLVRKGEAAFRLDSGVEGFKIFSFLPSRHDLFAGKLFVFPRRKITYDELPQVHSIFVQILLGTLRIETVGEAYEIHEGDCLLFHGDAPYSIENLLERDSIALFLTTPAFQL